MLDQSFSAENFRIILDYENRKGIHLEEKLSMDDAKELNYKIKECSIQIKKLKKLKKFDDVEKLYQQKKELRDQKDNALEKKLIEVSELISNKGFKIELNQISIPGGKNLYTIPNKPAHFFALRQVQRNISRLYKVKQANRNQLINQISVLLNNQFPKIVIRTDIKSFYESINQKALKEILSNNLLTPLSKRITLSILRSYNNLSGDSIGVPRGIGISAYLAELYMRDVDRTLKNMNGLSYYTRYVDDIVMVFTPKPSENETDYLDEIRKIFTKYDLNINEVKTKSCDTRTSESNSINFLGYNIKFGTSFDVSLTQSKKEKYKYRINSSFDNYSNLSKVSKKTAEKILLKRIRFLTGNTRLRNNKKNIMVGVYYSNTHLTTTRDFSGLDNYLKYKINSSTCPNYLKDRLYSYKFIDGFNEKRYSPFNIKDFSSIMEIWK